MTWTISGSLPKRTIALTLAAALAVTTATTAPARADNKDAIAAAAVFGLVAAVIIASSNDRKSTTVKTIRIDPRKVLPSECRFRIRHGSDRGNYFGRGCLSRNYARLHQLPHRCERVVERPHWHRVVVAYKAPCLKRYGFWADDKVRYVHR